MNPLLDPSGHPVIAHRGASGLAPENTCRALALALEQGADALEFDLRLAACGTPVLMHDPLLDRTTGGSGPLQARTARELGELDAGYHWTMDHGATFPWRGRGLGVPALAEVLDRFPAIPLLIELKTVEVAAPARKVLLERSARDRVVVASFSAPALTPFREAGFHTAASRRESLSLWVRGRLGMGVGNDVAEAYAVPDRYLRRIKVISTSFVAAARKGGRPIHVWTVNEPAQAIRFWESGVSGIITNFPALMIEARKRVRPQPT